MWKPTQTSNDVLMHSRGPWKRHKYIKVVNGEYVYPGDSVKSNMDTINTEKLHDANMRKVQAKKNAEKAQRQGMARTDATRRAADLATARKAIEAGRRNELSNRNLDAARNKAARVNRDEAARLRKLNAVNTTRKAQRQGRARTEEIITRNREALNERNLNAAKRKALNERNLNAARSKAASNREARLREQGNAEGRSAVKRQIRVNNMKKADPNRIKANVYNEQMKGRNRTAKAQKLLKGSAGFSKTAARARLQEKIAKGNSDYNTSQSLKYKKQAITADRIYEKGRRLATDDPRTRNKAKGKLPARLDVAAKQAGNAISREAYRTGYKARKAASSAAKSISAAAREAWNTASSYKDKFADFESFYKWYKKNVRK